jgi:SRSO17 transposase
VPAEGTCATTPPRAQRLLARALTAGRRVAWGTGAAGEGSDPRLRGWLEEKRPSSVLAVRRHERVGMRTGARRRQGPVAQLAATRPAGPWQRRRAGDGASGPRLSAWAMRPLVAPVDQPWGRGLLGRRRLRKPPELADSRVCGPVATPLAALVRVAGSRGASAECWETATGEVGLDHDAVRRWPRGSRHIPLALLAQAYLTVTRARASAAAPAKGGIGRWPEQAPSLSSPKRS